MQDEVIPPEPLAAGSITSWPTTEQFMNETTRDEACSFAAAELLEIIGPLSRAQVRLEKWNIPVAIKSVFNQKLRVAVANLYAAMPNQVEEQVKYYVLVEQAGGPEKFAELVAKFEAEQAEEERSVNGSTTDSKSASEGSNPSAPATGVVDDTAANGSVKSVPEGQLGSSPSSSTNLAELPTIPEQWPVQLGADNKLHIAPQPESEPAKVIQFKRPEPPQDTPPDGGTPVAAAA